MEMEVNDTIESTIHVYKDTERPTKLWEKLQVNMRVDKVEPLALDTPVDPQSLRFVCISDTHSRRELEHLDIPDGDVFLHGGDFSMVGKTQEIIRFNEFLDTLPHRRKVVIAGNHDLTFDPTFLNPENKCDLQRFGVDQDKVLAFMKEKGISEMKEVLSSKNTIYLEDNAVILCGIKIYGSPWQPVFCDWGFNLPRGVACLEKWNMIPDDTDVLLTHGPPLGYQDKCYDQARAGCAELLSTIQQRVKPKCHIFGHIHEAYGIVTDGVTTYINACTCTLRYKPTQAPIIFDVPIPQGFSKEEIAGDIPSNTVRSSDAQSSL